MTLHHRSPISLCCLALLMVGMLTTTVSANKAQVDMKEFVSRILDNSATPSQVESYIGSLSPSQVDTFGQLLATGLGVSAGQLDQTADSPAYAVTGSSSSNKVSLGHTLSSSSLVRSRSWYNHATKCDNDSSDVDRLFVYKIDSSKSHAFKWSAPSSAPLTAVLLYAYHTGGKPGVQGILSSSELQVCIGDTVVNAFSNETLWGRNYIGKQLKVRQY